MKQSQKRLFQKGHEPFTRPLHTTTNHCCQTFSFFFCLFVWPVIGLCSCRERRERKKLDLNITHFATQQFAQPWSFKGKWKTIFSTALLCPYFIPKCYWRLKTVEWTESKCWLAAMLGKRTNSTMKNPHCGHLTFQLTHSVQKRRPAMHTVLKE